MHIICLHYKTVRFVRRSATANWLRFFSGFKHRFDLTYLISETLPCLPYSAVPFPRDCYRTYSLTLPPMLAKTVAWLNLRNNDIPKRCCCCWDEADDDWDAEFAAQLVTFDGSFVGELCADTAARRPCSLTTASEKQRKQCTNIDQLVHPNLLQNPN